MKIHMRLFQRKGWYHVEFERNQRRALKTKDKAEARELFLELKRQYLAGKLHDLRGECATTLFPFSKEYKEWAGTVQPKSTYNANRLALDKLIQHAGDIPLDKITLKHLDAIVAQSKRDNLSTASINNYIRHLRTVLNKAVAWGYLKVNPLRQAKELPQQKKPPRFISRNDLSRFLHSIDNLDLRRVVVALVSTGRRRKELLSLTWADVDFDRNVYLVRQSKTHLSRHYPINSAFLAVLNSLERGTGKVFKRWRHPDTLSHYVKLALTEAGFADFRLHDLRHTFASLFMESGGNLRTLQDLLGHTEYRTTEIYAHIGEEHLREEVDRVKIGPVDLLNSGQKANER